MPPLSDPNAYGVETAARVKKKLKELSSGEMKITADAEYFST
jgi:hypothetical protein